ncbi:VOC family protein [Rhodococcus rhodochrous]|uniref:VOC family protein n=1 Tax=Rhodococcus rhodochrous TaxID=1829 RepID=UPI000B052976|nr:VOC family protein [Rhodococcus rhodochrous]
MMNPTARDYAGSPPPRWIGYIAVADADATAAKVAELGGKVLEELHNVPGVGRITMFTDPTGALVHVMQPEKTGA